MPTSNVGVASAEPKESMGGAVAYYFVLEHTMLAPTPAARFSSFEIVSSQGHLPCALSIASRYAPSTPTPYTNGARHLRPIPHKEPPPLPPPVRCAG